jgi:predicted Zn-ribbon and HTH transcriptional regulator
MDLKTIKQQFLQGTLSSIALTKLLPSVQEELDQLWPFEGSLKSKWHAYLHDIPTHQAACETSGRMRSFFHKQFRKFCGNQGTCACNRNMVKDFYETMDEVKHQAITLKRKKTSREKYGTDAPSQSDAIKEKTAQTCLERYGTRSPTQNPQVLEKSKQTCLKNWGVEWPQQNPDIFERTVAVFEDRYQSRRPAQNPQVRDQLRTIRRDEGYDILLERYPLLMPMFSRQHYVDSAMHVLLPWKCRECDHEFEQAKIGQIEIRCPICSPKKESWGERAIRQFLKQHGVEFEQYNRKIIAPKELDFFIADHNLAIEFNGIWTHRYHESAITDKRYHQNKWNTTHQQGIKLIQIWEHELLMKPLIVWDRLSHALGFKQEKIAARKCVIQSLKSMASREFFNTNHLQGWQPAAHTYALVSDGKVVAAASFSRSRFGKKAQWELVRYASVMGTQVQGGLGRLLKHAQTQIAFTSLVSYANLNWGRGNVYETLGFDLDSISQPNYWYFRGDREVHNRLKFQKHKIVGKAQGNSESEIAANMGYSRFYDAGNAVWIKRW